MAVNFFLTIGLFLLVFVGLVLAQIKLSSMDNKYFGLILPVISFIMSLAVFAGWASYESIGLSPSQNIFSLIISMLISNIPTFIYLFIYFGVREKNKINKQIDKMNINDL